MKYLSIIGLFAILASCTQKDPKMCACLEVSETLNEKTAAAIQKAPTKEEVATIKKLRDEKEQKCIDFQTMSGEEMLKKAATCKQ